MITEAKIERGGKIRRQDAYQAHEFIGNIFGYI